VKKLLLPIGLVAALAVSIGGSPATAQRNDEMNIVQTAQAAGNFKTLTKLARKAGLAGTLSKPGPYTVFAPTDAAFRKVPAKTLKSLGTATVTVSPPAANPDALKTKIKAFVSAYNDAVDLVRGELTEKRVTDPQTDDDAKLGVLFGDATLGGLLSKMRQTISEAGLDQLGVSVVSSGAANAPDTLAGKLTFDESTFDKAWAANPLAVKAKIGSPDGPGFAQDFEADLDPFTRAGGRSIGRVLSVDAPNQLTGRIAEAEVQRLLLRGAQLVDECTEVELFQLCI